MGAAPAFYSPFTATNADSCGLVGKRWNMTNGLATSFIWPRLWKYVPYVPTWRICKTMYIWVSSLAVLKVKVFSFESNNFLSQATETSWLTSLYSNFGLLGFYTALQLSLIPCCQDVGCPFSIIHTLSANTINEQPLIPAHTQISSSLNNLPPLLTAQATTMFLTAVPN